MGECKADAGRIIHVSLMEGGSREDGLRSIFLPQSQLDEMVGIVLLLHIYDERGGPNGIIIFLIAKFSRAVRCLRIYPLLPLYLLCRAGSYSFIGGQAGYPFFFCQDLSTFPIRGEVRLECTG